MLQRLWRWRSGAIPRTSHWSVWRGSHFEPRMLRAHPPPPRPLTTLPRFYTRSPSELTSGSKQITQKTRLQCSVPNQRLWNTPTLSPHAGCWGMRSVMGKDDGGKGTDDLLGIGGGAHGCHNTTMPVTRGLQNRAALGLDLGKVLQAPMMKARTPNPKQNGTAESHESDWREMGPGPGGQSSREGRLGWRVQSGYCRLYIPLGWAVGEMPRAVGSQARPTEGAGGQGQPPPPPPPCRPSHASLLGTVTKPANRGRQPQHERWEEMHRMAGHGPLVDEQTKYPPGVQRGGLGWGGGGVQFSSGSSVRDPNPRGVGGGCVRACDSFT